MTQAVDSFQSMRLNDQLIKGLAAKGFSEPTAIQKNAIPSILSGVSSMLWHNSGGETKAIISVTALQRSDPNLTTPQVIVVSPTKEDALQTASFIVSVAGSLQTKIRTCVNDSPNYQKSMQALEEHPHVVVGTPAQVHDLIKLQHLNIISLKTIMLDQVDVMLANGLRELLFDMLGFFPQETQKVLLSGHDIEFSHRKVAFGYLHRFAGSFDDICEDGIVREEPEKFEEPEYKEGVDGHDGLIDYEEEYR